MKINFHYVIFKNPILNSFPYLRERSHIYVLWGARRDLNPRPPESQSGILTNWTTGTIILNLSAFRASSPSRRKRNIEKKRKEYIKKQGRVKRFFGFLKRFISHIEQEILRGIFYISKTLFPKLFYPNQRDRVRVYFWACEVSKFHLYPEFLLDFAWVFLQNFLSIREIWEYCDRFYHTL